MSLSKSSHDALLTILFRTVLDSTVLHCIVLYFQHSTEATHTIEDKNHHLLSLNTPLIRCQIPLTNAINALIPLRKESHRVHVCAG